MASKKVCLMARMTTASERVEQRAVKAATEASVGYASESARNAWNGAGRDDCRGRRGCLTWREQSQTTIYSSFSHGQALHARLHRMLSVFRRQGVEGRTNSVEATSKNWLTCALSSLSHVIPRSIRQRQCRSALTSAGRGSAGGGTLRPDRSFC